MCVTEMGWQAGGGADLEEGRKQGRCEEMMVRWPSCLGCELRNQKQASSGGLIGAEKLGFKYQVCHSPPQRHPFQAADAFKQQKVWGRPRSTPGVVASAE